MVYFLIHDKSIGREKALQLSYAKEGKLSANCGLCTAK